MPHSRDINGFADPAFSFSMNFIGAPALTAAEFKNYRQDFILGASLRVIAPLGQYDDTKLVNIGAIAGRLNPRSASPKRSDLGQSKLRPRLLSSRTMAIFSVGRHAPGAHLLRPGGPGYTFEPGCWLAVNAAYFEGGRTTVDGVKNNDEQEGPRFGATLRSR